MSRLLRFKQFYIPTLPASVGSIGNTGSVAQNTGQRNRAWIRSNGRRYVVRWALTAASCMAASMAAHGSAVEVPLAAMAIVAATGWLLGTCACAVSVSRLEA